MSELIASRAFVIPEPARLAEAAPRRVGLLARIRAALRRHQTRLILRSLDPHLARDIGVTPAGEPLAGFTMDPRPLWRAGLAPMPADVLPGWPRGGR